MMTTSTIDPQDLLSALLMEDGRPWGQVAQPWQVEDARQVLAGQLRRHYLLRGRGMSKTSDTAAMALALLLTEAPPRSRSYVYAVDAGQAALFTDALAGFVTRTPGLAAAVELGARSVTVRATGATLAVESSDGASALGTRPWLTVADELGVWPRTANHRRLWSAIVSALPKVPDSRLVVIGTAGSPTGLGAQVWAEAQTSAHWHIARRPGPAPWWSDDDVASTVASLTASEYRRLILCEWAEGDDSLTTPEDVEAAIRPGSNTLPRRGGVSYVAALDVGTRRDLTALVVGHSEHRTSGRVTVIDRVLYWRPTAQRGGRVDLAEVEAATLRLAREYGVTRLRFDRMQAEQLTANLAREGVRTDEFVFSSSGANRLARSLYVALRDRALELPDDPELREEFLTTRLVETGPGTVKLQNPAGAHDDIVTAVGMVVADLNERPASGPMTISVPRARIDRGGNAGMARNLNGSRSRARIAANATPTGAELRAAARRQPRGVNVLLGVKGAWDDPSNPNDPRRAR